MLQPQGARDIGEPVVETQQNHFVAPLAFALALPRITADPVIAEAPQHFGRPRIAGRHHPALAGGDVLDRMKAEDRHMLHAAQTLATIFRA